jgi:hypothetical protein
MCKNWRELGLIWRTTELEIRHVFDRTKLCLVLVRQERIAIAKSADTVRSSFRVPFVSVIRSIEYDLLSFIGYV